MSFPQVLSMPQRIVSRGGNPVLINNLDTRFHGYDSFSRSRRWHMGFAIKNISRYQATSTAAEDLTFTHAKP